MVRAVGVIGLVLVVFGIAGYGIFVDGAAYLGTYSNDCVSYNFGQGGNLTSTTITCSATNGAQSAALIPSGAQVLFDSMLIWVLFLPGILILAGVALVLVAWRLASPRPA